MSAASRCKRDRRHELAKLQYSAVTAESPMLRNGPISMAELVKNDIQLITSGSARSTNAKAFSDRVKKRHCLVSQYKHRIPY